MALTRRQQRLYRHRCNIYRRSTAAGTGHGYAGQETVSLLAANVACYYDYTQNWDDPSAVGELKRANMETRDRIFLEMGQEINSGDFTQDVTPDQDGQVNPNRGTWHRIRGAARRVERLNEAEVPAMEVEKPPVV